MEKRRDQQTRIESKTRAVVRAKMGLASGDYSSALVLLRGAAAEFPNDAELAELEKLAADGVKRKAEADRLITESQELFAQQKSAKAIELLRAAYELDKNNALARTILANALVEHAHSIVETDWWEAETLANEAVVLNPAHPTAKTIQGIVLDRKMAGSVEEWDSQTRKLQSSGNLTAALSQIAEGLVVHPHDPRLLQIQDVVQRDHSSQRRQARRRDLEDLRRTAGEVDAVADAASKQALAERIRAVAARYATDGEILSVANGFLHRLGLLEVPLRSASAAAAGKGGIVIHHAPAARVPETALGATSPSPTGRVPSQSLPSPVLSTQVLPSVAAPSQVPPTQAPPTQIPPTYVPAKHVSPTTVPPRAIPAGNVATGVVPQSTAWPSKVPASEPEPRLAPPQTAIVPAAQSSAPEAEVTSPSSSPSAPLIAASSLPEQPTRSKSVALILGAAAAIILVAAISYFAGTHHAPAVDKTPSAAATVAAPTVSAPTVAAPTVAAPAVSAAVVSAHVSSPAHATPAPSSPTSALPAARLSSDTVAGKAAPDVQDISQQKIHSRKDEESRHEARQTVSPQPQPNPQPQPRLATLSIRGGAAGTAVLVDQNLVGTIQPDGTLSVSTVSPGDHTVELRKERFQPRQFKEHFVVGEAVSLAAADAALEATPGQLKITFSPADANVAIAKAGVLPIMVSSGVPLNLAAGTYTLTARTAERFTRSSTLEVIGGQSKTLDLSLAPNGMSKWDDPGAWKQEKDSFVRKGGDFVLYGAAPASGTFVFSATLLKGHVLQWVLNYTDPKNYVLFQMDDDAFYRAVIRNGEKTDEIKVPDKSDKKGFRSLIIRVSPTEIVHQSKHGNTGTVLDRWTQPGADLGRGKFGFYLPGNDQVSLSGFAHYVDLNIR